MRRPAHAARGPALAFICGAFSVAGMGGLDDALAAPIAIGCLAVLFALWRTTGSAKKAALLGYAYGCGLFLAGVSWVYVSMHDFGMLPIPLAALATILFCLALALLPAAAGALQSIVKRRPTLRLLLAMPASWALIEWTRGWILTGFPWLSLGYSQMGSPLAGFAPVLGVYGVGLLTAVCAAAVAAIAVHRHTAIAAATFVIVFVVGYGLQHHTWTTPVGQPTSVSLLQGNIAQDVKFVPGHYEHNLAVYARLVQQSKGRLIVLPETAIPRFEDQVDPEYLGFLKEQAQLRAGDVLVPVPVRDADGRPYNAVSSYGVAPTQRYYKRHLVPLGEFIPFGFRWFIDLMNIPLGDFSRGSEDQKPIDAAGQRVALNICYEDVFGEEISTQLPEATLLANVSNVAWFGDSLAPAQHLRISRMRAIETGRTMLRATNTGVTAIIASDGRVVDRLPLFKEAVLEGEAQGYTGATPYVRFGNVPAVALMVLMLFGAWAAGRFKLLARSPA